MAIALGFPIVRYDFFVLFRAHNRYTLQFQVGSIRFEENGHIVPTLMIDYYPNKIFAFSLRGHPFRASGENRDFQTPSPVCLALSRGP